ncbi:hypothetical protein PFISCL1PPCAC_26470, partial [Pristionchus fissidentatus]
LRVYFNPETESHLVAESVIFTLLSERHLGPKLYGIFSGGRLEEYIPVWDNLKKKIARSSLSMTFLRSIVEVHQLEVPIWKEPDYLCDALERWLKQLKLTPSGQKSFELPAKYGDGVPDSITCDDIAEELLYLRHMIGQSSSPVRFCHNDLQEGNILLPKGSSVSDGESAEFMTGNSLSAFNPAAPRLVLIDFEYASYNYRGFDFANHFVEWSIDYDVDEYPLYTVDTANFPSREQMLDFFVNYVRESDPHCANVNETAEKVYEETLPFVPISHIFWGVWGLLQVELSPVGFGFAEYGRERLALYYQNKHLVEGFAQKQ